MDGLPGGLDASGRGGGGDPATRGAGALEALLAAHSRAEALAAVVADGELARGLGWDRLVPLLCAGLARCHLAGSGTALYAACHRGVAAPAVAGCRMAADLARCAARLRAVALELRGRGAVNAVAMVRARDALSPSVGLSGPDGPTADRAPRRLCDWLVGLGVPRELTGRATWRLYGL